jgi:hypothetical protein
MEKKISKINKKIEATMTLIQKDQSAKLYTANHAYNFNNNTKKKQDIKRIKTIKKKKELK